MRTPYLVLGTIVLVATVVDILWTTLWVDGGSGPLSGRLTTGVWRGLRWASREETRLLSVAGPLILVATLVMWIAGLWVGWSLLFAGDRTALLSTHTGEPADWTGRVYYVAYTMFTNGNGDYTPTSGGWEIASALTTATGMALVTLGVSYVLTVLSAVSEKRSFASTVTGLGERSEAFVRAGYTERDGFDGLDLPLESLANQLSVLADQHQAYPILHYYHSEQSGNASAVAVAILDEGLTLARYGVAANVQPKPTLVRTARSSTDQYLDTLGSAFIDPAERTPPPPNLDRLREEGIETVSDERFAEVLDAKRERRRKLLGVVEGDAWEWPPVEEG
ncbi:potassium channel family protein [Halovivax gelatinilyticus]|uniref:potassium channel family protein n=1 Tax=Halovivax gelatinilyticus TaxID=2961597 RepID=UPI0020CA31E9|nr:potassium channel family protein [Halovivax gelatinilyticus]